MEAVRRYDVLDSPPDGAFDRITALAARLLGAPISIVSIVDTDRIWFKSHHGIDLEQISRDPGLCASAILQYEPWLVADARVDPRTLANPLVAGEFGLRFYAGFPLTSFDGHNLGTLCVIGQEPRELAADEVATMQDLAAVVMDQLELRLSARRTISLQAQLRENAQLVARTLQESLLPPRLPPIDRLEVEARYHVAKLEQVGGDFYDLIPTSNGCFAVVGDATGKGTKAASLTGTARAALRTVALEDVTPAQALDRLNRVLAQDARSHCTIAVAQVAPRIGGGADVVIALAGHPHPLVLRADGTVEDVGRTAPLAGWRNDVKFIDVAVELAPGDLMLLYTDGLLEAVRHGTVYDTALRQRLRELVGRSAVEVADSIDAALPPVLLDDAAYLVLQSQ